MSLDTLNPEQWGLSRQFDDPYLLVSSQNMPETLETALDMAMFLYYMNPNYVKAAGRVVRYFITDFDYPGKGSSTEKNFFDDFLHHQLQLPVFMANVGDEHNCYGNAFVRIHFPFDRVLLDPTTGREYFLELFGRRARFDLASLTYTVPDPAHPGQTLKLRFRDRRSRDQSRIKLRLLNPRRIWLQHNDISGTTRYIYRFEQETIEDVKKGRLHIVNEMPLEMLQAIRNSQDFMFEVDHLFHFREPTISGISNRGWGIPPVVINYRNLRQVQVYRKLDEAVGLDYMLPFRLFSPPELQNSNSDMARLMTGRWTAEIRRIVDARRRDKFAMHAFPFPVNYQEFGADEGKKLTPKDAMELANNTLYDGMGFPQELFKGTLQYLQVPHALRMFENSFLFVHTGYNQLLRWVVRRTRQYLGLPPLPVTLQRPTMADSVERKQMIFQLAATGEISRETAYDSLGIDDVRAEFRKRIEEDMEVQREQARAQAELQKELETGSLQSTEQAQGSGGTMPGGPVDASGATPMDATGDAQQLAEYWLQLPQGERSKAMAAAKNTKPDVYAMAKQKMEELRSQGAAQGRQAVQGPAAQDPTAGGGA
jgi:hypothetical protein